MERLLHALEMFETSAAQCLTLGSQALRDGAAETRAEVDAIRQAEDWQALAAAPVNAFWRTAAARSATALASCFPAVDDAPSAAARSIVGPVDRRAVVADALHTLNAALSATPARKKP
ncbi:hypothetical protein [Variovorax paradoxus]|uniref:hypothetical protein n=1 Tax=Variovorax paradoxus TaxID=34073 RepID=UPI0028615A06|nr:hypothetical protein [Variovorax paradoxus]MDR6454590.1 hypothetical protein [Variovorax paradoxus]